MWTGDCQTVFKSSFEEYVTIELQMEIVLEGARFEQQIVMEMEVCVN